MKNYITLDERIHCAKDELAEAVDHVEYLKRRIAQLEAQQLQKIIDEIPF